MKVRAATPDDAVAVAALAAQDEEQLCGRPSRLTEKDVAMWWSRVAHETDSWLYEDAGRLLAAGWAEQHDDLGIFLGIVAVDAKGRGLGSELVTRGEAYARAAGAGRVHTFVLEPDSAAASLLERNGFAPVRRFYDMAIELGEPPPAPTMPGGLTLEPFQTGDAYAFWHALNEAFQDHWEWHSIPFEQWWEEKQAVPDFDPTLWFVVRDADELAAVIRNEPDRNGGGYVGALGVRRAWRGRGLGRALLVHTFAEFRRRRVGRVTLGVDAESPTVATKLYESVGMTVESVMVVFEKALA